MANWPGTVIADSEISDAPVLERPTGPKRPTLSLRADAFPGEVVEDVPASPADGQVPAQTMPLDPYGQMDIGFGNRSADEANSRPAGSDDYVQEVNAGIANGAISDPAALKAVAAKYGYYFPDEAKVATVFDALKNGANFGGANPAEQASDISDIRDVTGNGGFAESADAFARGAPAVIGVDDEIGAAVDMAMRGGSWQENLARNRAIRDFDEDHHFWARLAGEFVGGAGLPSNVTGAARNAGRIAIRQGLSREAAQKAARLAVVRQLGIEGGGVGAAHGFGDSDGGVGDRAVGAVAGGAIGGTGGLAIGSIGAAMANRIAAKAALPLTEGQEVAQAAERQGIDVLPADVAEGPGVARATQGAAQTSFGANTVARAANRRHESFENRVGEFAEGALPPVEAGSRIASQAEMSSRRSGEAAENLSGAVERAIAEPTDYTGAGQLVQRGVSRWIDDTAERASALYNAVPISDTLPAVVQSTREALGSLTQAMESNRELSRFFRSSKMEGYLAALTPKMARENAADSTLFNGRVPTREIEVGGGLSWRDLSEFRTRVGDMLNDPRLVDKIAPRQLRSLYGALTRDMEATAERTGPEAIRAWRRANNYYDGRMKRINDTLSLVVGERKDKTANEAMSALDAMLRSGPSGNDAAFSRIMRSLPADDMRTVRATIVNNARGQRQFDPKAFPDAWGKLSERGRSALLPEPGLRSIMDDAAVRGAISAKNPFAGKSGEQVFHALEQMAESRGDSVRFRSTLSSLAPEEANAVRASVISRMGLASAGGQNATGDAFSISQFLTRWNRMTPDAKLALFGDGEMRASMNDLARIADRVKATERLAGHSNTGAINSFEKTTASLYGAVAALFSGHPLIAVGLAGPATYQRLSAQVLTSKRFLNWLAKAPQAPNRRAERAYTARLTAIAKAEPAIANDVLQLQARLVSFYEGAGPARLAADEGDDASFDVEPPRRDSEQAGRDF